MNAGPTIINTLVTEQNGITTRLYTITVTHAGGNNANLKSISLNSVSTLVAAPAGPGTNVNYTTSVSPATTTLTVTPTTLDPNATATVNGTAVVSGTASLPITLNAGTTVINTLITAQDGITARLYTITVTHAGGNNANLKSISLNSVSTLVAAPAGPGTNVNYTTSVSPATTTLTVTPITLDPNSKVTVNGTAVVSGTASLPVTLNAGPTIINTLVTAQDGITTRLYTITVTHAGGNNANIKSISLSTGSLLTIAPAGPGSNVNYTTSVSPGTTVLTVKPTTLDPNSTVTVNGTAVVSGTASLPVTLNTGLTIINTLVTAQDGITTRLYSITVTTSLSAMNSLYQPVSVNQAGKLLLSDGIMVHQGLSPNGDGINDLLIIDGIDLYPDNKLTIMNRSGATIFKAQSYDNRSKVFDGHSNINGAMQRPGTYFYLLEYLVNGSVKSKTGFIVLNY